MSWRAINTATECSRRATCPSCLPGLVNARIDLHAGLVVRRDDQRRGRVAHVLGRDRAQAIVAIDHLVNAPLRVELPDRRAHLAPRELLHDGLQRRVVLPHDRVEACGLDAGLLQLLVRPTSFDTVMLSRVAHEQHAVVRLETRQERVHLSRAGEARFIEHIESLLLV